MPTQNLKGLSSWSLLCWIQEESGWVKPHGFPGRGSFGPYSESDEATQRFTSESRRHPFVLQAGGTLGVQGSMARDRQQWGSDWQWQVMGAITLTCLV